MKPFEYVNAINSTKKDIMVDDLAEKGYSPYMINRSLSYFNDTVLYANEMNKHHHLENRMQFDFFINIVRKRKRFSKWIKPQVEANVEVIKEYYGYSNLKARQTLSLLTSDQIDQLREKVYKGGRTK